jgi:hypothetical protein
MRREPYKTWLAGCAQPSEIGTMAGIWVRSRQKIHRLQKPHWGVPQKDHNCFLTSETSSGKVPVAFRVRFPVGPCICSDFYPRTRAGIGSGAYCVGQESPLVESVGKGSWKAIRHVPRKSPCGIPGSIPCRAPFFFLTFIWLELGQEHTSLGKSLGRVSESASRKRQLGKPSETSLGKVPVSFRVRLPVRPHFFAHRMRDVWATP